MKGFNGSKIMKYDDMELSYSIVLNLSLKIFNYKVK